MKFLGQDVARKFLFVLNVQTVASPVLGKFLQQSKAKNGMRYIKIPGVPYESVYTFIRFLYSSWYVVRLDSLPF